MKFPIKAQWEFYSEIRKNAYNIKIQEIQNTICICFYDAWEIEGNCSWCLWQLTASFFQRCKFENLTSSARQQIPQDLFDFAQSKCKSYQKFL